MNLYNEIDKLFLLQKNPFKKTKEKNLKKKIFNSLTRFHSKNCQIYKNILLHMKYRENINYDITNLPFLPTNLFKSFDLLSVKKKDIIKTIRSSGTTSKKFSKIFLDKRNSQDQIKVLSTLFSNVINTKKRLPMLIIDTERTIKNRNSFSARTAAINGFSIFCNEICFALNDDLSINFTRVKNFLKKYKKEKKIIFGFTGIIWKYFCNNSNLLKKNYNFSDSIILHGGGWKKLVNQGITNKIFKIKLKKNLKISKVINYYGMVEQTGSIFFECPHCQNFISSIFSDIIIRDKNFKDLGSNKVGVIQLLSVLPTSYPGHNILTEDLGIITKKKHPKCKHSGAKMFKVIGRLEKSEIRGCSDAIV